MFFLYKTLVFSQLVHSLSSETKVIFKIYPVWKVSRIRRFSGPHSVRMRENTDQKNSKYENFSCIEYFAFFIVVSRLEFEKSLLLGLFGTKHSRTYQVKFVKYSL